MTSTILGKRSRTTSGLAVVSTKRSRRQITTPIYNDENVAPQDAQSHDEDFMRSDEADELSFANKAPIERVLFSSQRNSSPRKLKFQKRFVRPQEEDEQTVVQLPTPKTPRHRDALSKRAPITPRHQVRVIGKTLTPSTPRLLSSPSFVNTVYHGPRQLFARSADPGRLVGREDERCKLHELLQSCFDKASGGCVYVSGPPGTGKSALVTEVTSNLKHDHTLKKASLNCMSMKTSKDIYSTIMDQFCSDVAVLEGEESQILQEMFVPRSRSDTIYLLTLDEIDHVLTLDMEFMYKLFEWSLQKSSRLILIGIANALDLTDRFLPRLKARNFIPQLLPILPYNVPQIKAVITSRLRSLLPANAANPDYVPFLHPAAIELCSRKVSSQSGDLRKALDICRRAIELVELETKQKRQKAAEEQMETSPSKRPLGENPNLSSPVKSSPLKRTPTKTLTTYLADLTVETAPRASIAHVNKITSSTLGNGTNQRLKTLNLQQKASLCALVALEKRKRATIANILDTPPKSARSAPTVKELFDTYCKLCKRDSVLHPLTSTEFRDVIGSLETLSLVSAVDGKNGSFVGLNTPSKRGRKGFGSGVGTGDEKRVASCVSEKELDQAAEGAGAGILKCILSGEGLD